MSAETLSIIIPQYKTEALTRLCLRSLRKRTRGPCQVIVVDNGSSDGSLEYLRGVPWIELIENTGGRGGGMAHWEALELGRRRARGEWLCLFHSDTIVIKDGWDAALMDMIRDSGAVGLSTYLRDINRFERGPDRWKRGFKELVREAKIRIKGDAAGERKVMSFCFIVQKSLVEETGLDAPGKKGEAVSAFYHERIKGRYPFLMLGRGELEPLLWHTSNATSILTGQMTDPALVNKYRMKTGMLMNSDAVREVMDDASLDR